MPFILITHLKQVCRIIVIILLRDKRYNHIIHMQTNRFTYTHAQCLNM